MNDFCLYFSFGFHHILTWEALDHILFVAALCLRYQWPDWKKILVLITAFTFGHCSTLLLSTFNIINLKTGLTEFFIALTIMLTAFSNALEINVTRRKKFPLIYFMALLFGMIHGLGFAYGIKSILGKNENITWQLLAFNSGIEVAQLVIVSASLFVSFFIVSKLKVVQSSWVLFASGIIFSFGLQMAIDRNPFKKNVHETIDFSYYDDGKR